MGEIEIWTDGSCDPNPGKGGWAFALNKEEYKSGTSEHSTNNRMEMTAVAEAIAYVKYEFPSHSLRIYSDSQYVVNGFNSWMHSWKKKGWTKKGGEIKNLDIWKTLYDNHEDVTLVWVKGHSGNDMNEFVDVLASGGDLSNVEIRPIERIDPLWENVFKEFSRWVKGGYKNEDRDSLLRRLQSKYSISVAGEAEMEALKIKKVSVEDPENGIVITYELIESLKTHAGGYSKKGLELLGVEWPPEKGWKARILGNVIDRGSYDRLMLDPKRGGK
ncbi:ribonuclease HI [Muricauda sp. CAU 1633]|uniref:ribonuclease H family protein n=1 Tax=Allomuricauda sp. CAU 1633 TaxID=2816036 RepID=UPI001A8D9301|nr:ribonuclease H [Muricauda sp. CAU 1633]MBO0323489.1 ribonuclease HI [Muricauda sp. CAU 1633]